MFGKTIKATVALAAAHALAAALAPATANAQRGSAGHLNILYWQAASTVNPTSPAAPRTSRRARWCWSRWSTTTRTATWCRCSSRRSPRWRTAGVASDLRSIHLPDQEGRPVVRRRPAHRPRRGVLRRVLPAPGRGLQRRFLLHGRDRVRGARRPHREDQLRGRETLSLRPLRRIDLADHPEGPVRGLHGRQGPGNAPSRTSAPSAPPLQGR